MNSDKTMTIVEHLEELRYRLLLSLVSVGVCAIISAFYLSPLINILSQPVGELVFLRPVEAFMVRFKMAMVLGVFTSLPLIIFQAWKFVVVALRPRERRIIFVVVPVSYALSVLGLFSAWLVLPLGLKFLLSFGTASLRPMITIDAYISFLTWMCLGFALCYQLPVVMFLLGRLGIVTSEMLSRHRRHAVVMVLFVAAVLTPGPDIASQMILSLPTYILYEASIWIVKWTCLKKKASQLN